MAKKLTKKKNLIKNILQKKNYSIDEAISFLKKIVLSNFIETVELSIRLNMNYQSNKQARSSIFLPHGTGKNLKIAVFIEEFYVQQLLNVGVTIAGLEIILEKIKLKKLNFNLLITTPQLLGKLIEFGKILGPKGLMPSLKLGTVTKDVFQAVKEYKNGKIDYSPDKTGIIHLMLGKIDFTDKQLKENLIIVYKTIEKNKSNNIKGKYIKSCFLSTTQGPSIKLNLIDFKNK
jgi:large subunit ribosomal protein L1